MANIVFAEAPGLNDSIFGKSQAPIRAIMERAAEAYEQKSIGKLVFNHEKSNNWAEKTTSMTAMRGPLPVGENGAYPTDGYQEGFSKVIEHMVWKDRFDVSREMLDDNKVVNFNGRQGPASFIAAYHRTMEEFAAAMIGNAMMGNNSTFSFHGKRFDVTGADQRTLFNTEHPSSVDSTYKQTNMFAGDITAENIGKLETAMQMFTDDNGNLGNVTPTTLLIPNLASLKQKVVEIVGSDKRPEDSSNAMNFQSGRWNIWVWPYLNKFITAGQTPIIMLDPEYNKHNNCAVWYDRVGMEVTSGIDVDTDANYWKLYSRFGAGFSDWRAFAVLGVTGGTAI